MAIIFPASPSNNDTVVINGKKYIYKSADTAWQRDGAGTKYSVTSDEFDGDGSTTAFTLSRVSSTEATFVALNGIVQEGGIGKSYTVSNTTLTFATAPAVGERVVARNLVAISNDGLDIDAHLNQSNPTSGYVLSWNGSDYAWAAAGTLDLGDRIKIPTSASAPSSPAAGDMYFDTSEQTAKLYDSTSGSWKTVNAYLPYDISYLIIAGGGAGGAHGGTGAGAGGYRNSYASETSGGGGATESPISAIAGRIYTITVGAGASAVSNANGGNGTNSSITGAVSITSTGGAGGRGAASSGAGFSGGSGSGGVVPVSGSNAGGSGTTGQGYAGGTGYPNWLAGGGGGAGAVGGNGNSGTNTAGSGGSGLASSISGSSVTRAGGGGGSSQTGTPGSGGSGGGGAGVNNGTGGSGSVNTGSGGGGLHASTGNGGAGGSGVVILRMPTANYSGTYTGSPSISTSGSDTILVFNSSGSYTA